MAKSRSPEELSQLCMQLEADLGSYIKEVQGRRTYHGRLNNSLVLASIFMSGAITIAGIYDQAEIAAIFGVLLSVLLSVQQAFPFGEMAFFYRCSLADLENLQSSLKFTDDTQEVEKIARQYAVIRKYIAQAIPRGQGINIVQNMRDELKKT
jgi:hypothetical protein